MEIIVHIFHEFYLSNLKRIRARIAARVFNVFDANTMSRSGIQTRDVISHRFSTALSFTRVLNYFCAVTCIYIFHIINDSC